MSFPNGFHLIRRLATLGAMQWTAWAQTIAAFGAAAAGITGPFWNYRKWVEEQYRRITELQAEVHGDTLIPIRQTFGALVEGGALMDRGTPELDDDENHAFFTMLRFFQRANAVYQSFPTWSRRTRHYLLDVLEPEILIWKRYLDSSQAQDSTGWLDSRGRRLDAAPTRTGLDKLSIALERRNHRPRLASILHRMISRATTAAPPSR